MKHHLTLRHANPLARQLVCLFTLLGIGFCLPATLARSLIFACAADNDLYHVASENGMEVRRFDALGAAVAAAAEGEGVLLLADGYPAKTTTLDAALFDEATRKRLRLFVEYPSFLPGMTVSAPRGTHWERAVVASEAFAPALARLRILALHDCRFVPVKVDHPHLVIGRVAGFDTAVYGLAKQSFPILFDLPRRDGGGEVLVATTKLSHFLTGRYAPTDAWQCIWNYVFAWLQPGQPQLPLKWTTGVRPSLSAEERPPADLEHQALRRGIEWYFNSRMLVHASMTAKYDRPANGPYPAAADPDLKQDWPYGHRIAIMPGLKTPPGDGSLGVMEGFDAKIFANGTQPVRWWNRADCNAETAGAMAAAGLVLPNPNYLATGRKIGDWLFFRSRMTQGHRADPQHPAFGLIGWNDSPQYCGPGSMDGYAVYYGDDNARSMLGMMLAAAALKTDRYDERLLQALLANLRISGRLGFQPDRVDQGPLEKAGWEHFFRSRSTSLSPHFQATMWACYLWAYRHTGFELFLQRARTAIGLTMDAYPDHWVWTNGLQQERAKMLLALAWLVRAQDTPEHRAWLRRIADDLMASQDPCGAIREVIGQAGQGGCPPPASNEAYGTAEAPLIQSNADAASDLLYTCNFALFALHEAAAATGNSLYRTAEEKLANFLCRIQIRSESHPELDGGWFRAFDFKRWEYWASSTDAGWGAWSIESGWTQSWITSVLALRQMQSSLWDITADSRVGRHFAALRPRMVPEDALVGRSGEKARHAAVGKPVTLRTKFSASYPGDGAASLTDGLLDMADYHDPAWLGFQGDDLVATIDLGEPIQLRELSGSFLQDVPFGIFLPRRVEFRVGNNLAGLQAVGTAAPVATEKQPGPVKEILTLKGLNVRARYVEVRAASLGKIPSWHQAAGAKAWLFADEIMINPAPVRQ